MEAPVSYNRTDALSILRSVKKTASESLESETIEFKEFPNEKSLFQDKHLAVEVCALTNHRGGLIIIGVRDSSQIKDKKWIEQLQGFDRIDVTSFKERLLGKLQSSVDIQIENIDFEGKNYLTIFVPKKIDELVTTSSGKACTRSGRSSRPMTPKELESAVKALHSYDWSADLVPNATKEKLNIDNIRTALGKYVDKKKLEFSPTIEAFLESIGVTSDGFLTKGGLLFFGKPEVIRKELGDFEFRFSWKEGVDLKINEVWLDNLWVSVLKANGLIERCIRNLSLTYDGQPFTVPNIDPLAFHEAFINAIVHRDYSIDGMVSVNFTGKRLFITSPGGFYGGVNSENIVYHEPRHRNKMLARVLMDFSLVDRAGMGVSRMGIKSLVYGRSFPTFKEINNTVNVEMDAEYCRAGIVALTNGKTELFVPDLVILNCLYEKGISDLLDAFNNIKNLSNDRWRSISDFLQRWEPIVELGGSKEGIFIVVRESAIKLLEVQKIPKMPSASQKYVNLFLFLKRHGVATNEEISNLLKHGHSSTTSRFLKEIDWIEKSGKGIATRFRLANAENYK